MPLLSINRDALLGTRLDGQECGRSNIPDNYVCHVGRGLNLPDVDPKRIAGDASAPFMPTADARKLAAFIAKSDDPESMLERLIPGDWSSSELKREIKSADKAEKVAKAYGVEDFGDLENLPDSFRDAVKAGDASKIPAIPGADDLYARLFKTPDPAESLEYVEDYSAKQLSKMLSDEDIRAKQSEQERFAEFQNEVKLAREEAEQAGEAFDESFYQYTPSDDPDSMSASTRAAIAFAIEPENRKAFQKFNRWNPYSVDVGDFNNLAEARESKRMAEVALSPSMRAVGRVIEGSDRLYNWLEGQAKAELKRRDRKDGKPAIADSLLRNDALYGVRFEGRNTSIVVHGKDRSEAISRARKKKKRGGDKAVEVWQLNETQAKQARAGRWVRTNSKGESRAKQGHRGQGPKPKAYRGDGADLQARIDALTSDLASNRLPVVARVAARRELRDLRSRFDDYNCSQNQDGRKVANTSGKIPGKKCGGSYISASFKCKSHKKGGKLTAEGKASARELAAKIRNRRGLKPISEKPPKPPKPETPKTRKPRTPKVRPTPESIPPAQNMKQFQDRAKKLFGPELKAMDKLIKEREKDEASSIKAERAELEKQAKKLIYGGRDTFDEGIKLQNKAGRLSTKLNKLQQKLKNQQDEVAEKLVDQIMKTGGETTGAGLVANSILDRSNVPENIASPDKLKKRLEYSYRLTGGKVNTLSALIYSDDRAYANKAYRVINVGKQSFDRDSNRVFLHEYGHHLEYSNQKHLDVSLEFIKSRSGGQKKSLNELEDTDVYDAEETAFVGNFVDPYVGKDYGGRSTEVISMGLERFADTKSMVDFYQQDKEHFLLILGMLR